MNKIYILLHEHLFEDGHTDYKLIGLFLSKKKALKVLEDSKKLEGFKNYLKGFYIQECIIDKIDNKILKELMQLYTT